MASLATDPRDLESLLHQAEIAHGHLCAGQILGVRLALLALRRLNIEDPRSRTLPDGTLNPDRKRLVTFVEIDRCATDAIAVVTACRLGKRALKFHDWGKMAATFVDLASPIAAAAPSSEDPTAETPTYKAIRIAALESSKQRARDLYPHIENKNEQQMRAYRELLDSDLFSEQWVAVPLHPREMPGYKSPRIACALCGEGINYDRESIIDNQTLCQSCAHPESRYYHPLP
jgi:formylmethanofuran dehydrogenase subunit E